MNELGPFLQAKFGKRTGGWVELPEVKDVFDQVGAPSISSSMLRYDV
jgi:hypothetical protein